LNANLGPDVPSGLIGECGDGQRVGRRWPHGRPLRVGGWLHGVGVQPVSNRLRHKCLVADRAAARSGWAGEFEGLVRVSTNKAARDKNRPRIALIACGPSDCLPGLCRRAARDATGMNDLKVRGFIWAGLPQTAPTQHPL
jgi:hypothetical protein